MAKSIPHGKDSSYSNHRCRCQACKDAHSSVMRAYKAKNNDKMTFMRTIRSRRRILAEDFVKTQFPDLWEKWTDEIKYELGVGPDAADA